MLKFTSTDGLTLVYKNGSYTDGLQSFAKCDWTSLPLREDGESLDGTLEIIEPVLVTMSNDHSFLLLSTSTVESIDTSYNKSHITVTNPNNATISGYDDDFDISDVVEVTQYALNEDSKGDTWEHFTMTVISNAANVIFADHLYNKPLDCQIREAGGNIHDLDIKYSDFGRMYFFYETDTKKPVLLISVEEVYVGRIETTQKGITTKYFVYQNPNNTFHAVNKERDTLDINKILSFSDKQDVFKYVESAKLNSDSALYIEV